MLANVIEGGRSLVAARKNERGKRSWSVGWILFWTGGILNRLIGAFLSQRTEGGIAEGTEDAFGMAPHCILRNVTCQGCLL